MYCHPIHCTKLSIQPISHNPMVPKGPLKINGPIWAYTKRPNKTKDILVISKNPTCKTLAYMNPRKPHSFCDSLHSAPIANSYKLLKP